MSSRRGDRVSQTEYFGGSFRPITPLSPHCSSDITSPRTALHVTLVSLLQMLMLDTRRYSRNLVSAESVFASGVVTLMA